MPDPIGALEVIRLVAVKVIHRVAVALADEIRNRRFA